MKIKLPSLSANPSIKTLVKNALNEQQKIVNNLQSSKDNSSVKENYLLAVGRVDALDAVLQALNKNTVLLKLLGE